MNSAKNIAYCVFHYPSKECVPILNRFLTFNVLEEESLNALVQINGIEESARIKSYIKDSSKFDVVLRAARTLHDSLDTISNIPELVLRSLAKMKANSPERIDNVLELLLETREEKWLGELDTLISSEQLKNDLLHAFQLRKNDPSDIAAELYALGIAKRIYSSYDIAKARGCEIYFGENSHIYKMLHFSGLYLSLDSIVSFQSITPTLNYIYQNSDSVLSNIITGVKHVKDSSYTFTFIYRNKAYIYNYLTPNILQKDLISVINSILADNGIERSFQIISSDFEATQYLFAKEKAIKAFKETFLLEKSTENLL